MRDVYCQTLLGLARKDPRIMILDADLMRSHGTMPFKKEFPQRAIDVGVAEANMVGVAAGLSNMVTDAVFFWATQEELEGNHFDSRKAMAFFVPEGTCFFLKPMVLHLAPSATDKNGFRSIIILEKGTNTPLGELDGSNEPQREVLFMPLNLWYTLPTPFSPFPLMQNLSPFPSAHEPRWR